VNIETSIGNGLRAVPVDLYGERITRGSLPKLEAKWSLNRRYRLFNAIRKSIITRADAREQYLLGDEEFAEWEATSWNGRNVPPGSTKVEGKTIASLPEIFSIEHELAGTLIINRPNHAVSVGQIKRVIQPWQFRFIELLVLNRNMVVTRQMFLSTIFKGEIRDEKTFEVYACSARKSLVALLKDAGMEKPPAIIETIWGRGYAMRVKSIHELSA
jgi:DNA-binding winged helix-turn-helix (wHTH) protein